MKLSIAYFGTPDFSARFLESLLSYPDSSFVISLVCTQPDKVVGRKKVLTPSPVKEVARKHDIVIIEGLANFTPNSQHFSLLKDSDIALVYAYGNMIPPHMLSRPRYGFYNIHPSLLPLYRGASPIAYPLLLGDTHTGVSIMKMDDELDHGPILAQEKYTIQADNTRKDLETKLTDISIVLFSEVFKSNSNQFQPIQLIQQDHSSATYTRRLTRDDGYIPLSLLKKALRDEPLTFKELPPLIREYCKNNIENCKLNIGNSPKIIHDYFRGLSPWPGVWTKVDINGQEKRLKITDVVLHQPSAISNQPSTINHQQLIINRVQLEGKSEISFTQFIESYSSAFV